VGIMLVTKRFSWNMGHRITFHQGKCYHPHGHTYHLEVSVEGDVDDKGFVMDFDQLKEIVQREIIDRLDHTFLCFEKDPILRPLFEEVNQRLERPFRVVYVPFETTTENLILWFHELLEPHLGARLKRIRLWETPTSFAEMVW